MEFLILVFALCAVGSLNVLAKPVEESNSIFRHVFKSLHRGPPFGGRTGVARVGDVVETNWIEQKLDNFDENINDTWKMRYISNSGYYESGGPLFIYVGGEWGIAADAVTEGPTVAMGKKHKGYIFYTEHRYYGESHPTKDMSVENLKYLDIRQALADLAHFVRTMKATIPGAEKSKVIMVGCSYAATMTIWFEKLYPDLLTGGWASSGPILAKTNFVEYKEVVGQSINDVGGKQCYDRIQNSFEQLQDLFKNNRVAEVKALFKICNNFNEKDDMDVWNFFYLISEYFAGLVQYSSSGSIEQACTYFDGETDDYISLAKYTLMQLPQNVCNDMTYKKLLQDIVSDNSTDAFLWQWTYQTCNEFGYYQTTDSKKQPFGNLLPLDYFIAMCGDLYGKEFTRTFVDEQVKKTNEMFGGLNPGVQNIYFTQGSLDQWKAMGINNNTIGAVIPLASHCNDLSYGESDNPFVRASKNRIFELVEKWLQDS